MAAGLRRQCAQVRRLPSVNKINILVKIAVGIINAQVSNDNQQTPPYAYPSHFYCFTLSSKPAFSVGLISWL